MQVQRLRITYKKKAQAIKSFCVSAHYYRWPDNAKEFHTVHRLQEECKKLNYPYYLFKLTGGYTTYEDGVRKFHNKDDKKGFEVGAMALQLCVVL